MSKAEFAKAINASPAHIDQIMSDFDVKSVLVGTRYRIPRSEADRINALFGEDADMNGTPQAQLRRKLLRLLDRKTLEQMSNREQPWHCDRETLEADLIATWPHDDIVEAIDKIVGRAQ